MAIEFSQSLQQFNETKNAAINALNSIFPVKGRTRELVLQKAWVEDTLDTTDYRSQAKARTNESTWGTPVFAHLKLIDLASGNVIDENPKTKVFTLPKPTQRNSYIVGGNEYQVHNQLRLKPGVYTIRKQNGELKTQVNLSKGKNFDLHFDEAKGLFSIQKVGGGQANITLLPILSYLGVARGDVVKAWGEKITASNEVLSDPKSVDKLGTALGLKGEQTVQDYLSKTQIDPNTTKASLGHAFDKVDGLMLLASSKNLLQVHLGKEEATDRDSLEFKELHSINDFIKERLQKNSNALTYKIKRTIDNPKRIKISQLLNTGAFSNAVETFFLQDDKSSTPEQTNPLEMLTGTQKVTIMGAGGIGTTHAITPEMRQIHPSHLGLIDPVHTPSSDRIGANMHLPLGAVKDGNQLKVKVVDKKGNEALLDPVTMKSKYVVFPDEHGTSVRAMYQGQIVDIPRSKADYFIPTSVNLFSYSTNLIPFLPSAQGNRAEMGAKMMEQAISLTHREAPLVQSLHPEKGETFEKIVGDYASVKSPTDGTVKKVTDDTIVISTPKGDITVNLYNNFALNRKSFIHNYPIVKAGDKVTKDQLLADSNYTKNGTLALGTNLNTAYLAYKGLNFDDGIVISAAAADKLTSEHIYKKELTIFPTILTGLATFRNYYPSALQANNLAKLDSDGVIKKGETVKFGDVLIAVLQKRIASQEIGLISKVLSERPKDVSIMWQLEDEGKVLDVLKTDKRIVVTIKTSEAAKIGDKLSNRHGGKGVITKIIPTNEMPKNGSGMPMDILMSPLGIISRINVSQTYESAVSKIADKSKKPYIINNFSGVDHIKQVKKDLAKAGIDDKEELFDGDTGKSLGDVHVGKPHIIKLMKQSQVNYSVRQGGPGHGYDANLQPLKAGGEEGSKSMDVLTIYSMLSHGARENLREMSSIKNSKNDEYWKALKSGELLPPPQPGFAFQKFMGYLKGAGIDVKKDGTKMMLAPFTDNQVRATSSKEITKPLFYRAKDMEPIKDGFFDKKLGGLKGEKWGHLELAEPVINPPFENAVKKVTGLGAKFDDIMAGKLHLTKDGELNSEGKGVTGGSAIEQLLKNINVDAELKTLKAKSLTTKAAQLDDINKRMRYLTALKVVGLTPVEAYIRKTLPVVPPNFRPIYPLPDGNVTTADSNVLYQNTGVINTMMKLPVMSLLDESSKTNIRNDLYEHVKAVSGISDMNIKGKQRSGFISEIKGTEGGQPKEGFFISKLLSKRQDYVGRGTVIPEPSLGIDELAMPEPMAWKLFEPFIIRELKNHGLNPIRALEEIKLKTPLAKKALEIAMKQRHVLLNRAPSLHKFSIMAFKPKITDGKSIKVPPLINKGFNLDYDGDTMTLHMPISDAANEEAKKMLPSNNLFQPGSGNLMMVPSQESLLGLFYLAQKPEGRKLLEAILGPKYPLPEVLDKKGIATVLGKVAHEAPQDYAAITQKLKQAGEKHVYDRGFSIGVNDISDFSVDVKKITTNAQKMINSSKDMGKTNADISTAVDSFLKKKLEGTDNPFYDQLASGAKGSASQLRSILISPMFVSDAKGKVIPTPIRKSYAAGLGSADYWMASYGVRKGMMDTSLQTSLPGAFSKSIMATVIDNVISTNDCGTHEGIILPIKSNDVLERYLAGDQGGFAHNTLVDMKVINDIKKQGVDSLSVRSPLKCRAVRGTCAHCYGLDEHGHIPEIGENVGAKSGQTISEPLVQLIMNTKHTGGVAGTGAQVGGYKRIDQLLALPSKLAGAAALAPTNGKVTRIVKGLAGGFDVYIGDKKTHVSQGTTPIVEVGQVVERGDSLSTGPIKPQDLTALKGVEPTQTYLTNELQKTYKDQGIGINRKTFETIVRSLTNTTQVHNAPKHSTWLPGDIIPHSVASDYNLTKFIELPVEEAEGDKLFQAYGPLQAGHTLTHKDVVTLSASGIKSVKVDKESLDHKPFVKGMNSLPMLKQDWMASLGYRYLAKSLTEGASQGWRTDIENYHPIPAIAYGATFGKGKEGKY